jgi:hypothetical protein
MRKRRWFSLLLLTLSGNNSATLGRRDKTLSRDTVEPASHLLRSLLLRRARFTAMSLGGGEGDTSKHDIDEANVWNQAEGFRRQREPYPQSLGGS